MIKQVLIFGHYGGYNAGDEIMLQALIKKIMQFNSSLQIKVICKNDELYRKSFINRVSYKNVSFINTLIGISESNTIILGGGTHFHDDYNLKRLRRHYKYLIKIILISLISKILGKKLFYLGVGYGPFNNKCTFLLAKISLLFPNKISVRDSFSLNNLKIKHSNNIYNSFDLVGLLNFKGYKKEFNKNILGVSLTSFEFSAKYNDDSYWQDLFLILADELKQNLTKIKIFVFRVGNKESDFELSEKLFQEMSNIDTTRVEIIKFEYSKEDLFLENINSCNWFIATRYHSAVLSYLMNCKLLIIPYHGKLYNFAQDIGLEDNFILHKSEMRNKKIVNEKINNLFNITQNITLPNTLVNKLNADIELLKNL